MSRLSVITTSAERMLLGSTAALVLAVHLGGLLLPAWAIQAIPLGEEIQQVLPAAQLILLAGWTVLGPGPIWLRLPVAPVLLVFWAVGWSQDPSKIAETASQWLPAAGLAAAIIALGIRCCGLRLTIDTPSAAFGQRHPQFSIGALIILTTLIAVALGILEWLRPTLRTDRELSIYLERLLAARMESGWVGEFFAGLSPRHGVLAAALAAAAMTTLGCVLRPGPMWLRLLVTAVLVPLLGIYLANLTGSGREASVNLAISLTVLSAVVGVSALPLRLLDMRLSRRTGFQPVLIRAFKDRLKTCPTENTHEPRTSIA